MKFISNNIPIPHWWREQALFRWIIKEVAWCKDPEREAELAKEKPPGKRRYARTEPRKM
jgi:hypothetical protein